MRQRKEAALQRLRELADNPAERAAFAATLLQPKLGLDVVRTALRILVAHPHLPARPALVKLYDHYAEQGVTRDPGTYVRSEILRGLRPIAEVADIDLLERALLTYEFPAPAFKEEAALLRSGALVMLAELDDVRARFHATRLLADPLTDPMSGQPALTAIEVLSAQGELLPLYYYATQEQSRMHAEVASHCLRALGELPAEAIPPLVACFEDCANSMLLVGLIDLLLQQPRLAISQATLARLMYQVKDADLYRYLATVLLAAGHMELRQMVLDAARGILDQTKLAILTEVLTEVLSGVGEMDDVTAALAELRAKRSSALRW